MKVYLKRNCFIVRCSRRRTTQQFRLPSANLSYHNMGQKIKTFFLREAIAISRGAITKYLCKVAVQRKLCRRFALSGCFLFTVLHTESAVKSNAILIGNIYNSDSLVVNFNLLFSVTATLVGSVYHNFVNQIV